jgi:multidrug efflux pump
MSRAALAIVLVAAGCKGGSQRHVESRAHGPHIRVTAALPGASPSVIASSVTTPLERAFGSVPHLVAMTSSSRDGQMTIELALDAGTDAFAATSDIQRAITGAMMLLPRELPAPPSYAVVDPPVAVRYAYDDTAHAEIAADAIAKISGVGQVELCGASPRGIRIVFDPAKLAATGLAITDAIDAVRAAKASTNDELRRVVIATRNGAPIREEDLANVQDWHETPACRAIDPHGPRVTLAVHPQPGADPHGVTEKLASAGAIPPLPAMHEVIAELPADMNLTALGEALVGQPAIGAFVVEVPTDAPARVLVAGDANVAAATLRALPGVLGAGQRIASVEVSGADPVEVTRVGRALADRFASEHALVVAHGIREHLDKTITIDRDAASRLGVTASAIALALRAQQQGVVAATVFGQVETSHVTVVLDQGPLYVRGASGLVPLDAMVAMHTESAPIEVVHVAQFPAAIIDVTLDAARAQAVADSIAHGPDVRIEIH